MDNKYYGMVPQKEIFATYRVGDQVSARVVRVREDGKLDLSLREKAYIQMERDEETILKALDEFAGVLPFGEKASPEVIKRELHMSKNAFKRALGGLLKEKKIEIKESSVRRI